MANIRVNASSIIRDGSEVMFRSPCDCSKITGLIVYYPSANGMTSHEFVFADAHNADATDINELFAENAMVKVILDITNSKAFVQNADTNSYLESKFKALEELIAAGGGVAVPTYTGKVEVE